MRKLVVAVLFLSFAAMAVAQAASAPKPYAVEYYYKVKWGYTNEFLELFKKNHYPLLKKQVASGRMLSVKMEKPQYHMTEEERWDFRVTIVFKDAAAANGPSDEEALIKQTYPDQATYKKEEQRRFEILIAHWDLPLEAVDLNSAP